MTQQHIIQSLNHYRHWFYAAAVYNLLWGSLNVIFPSFLFDLIDTSSPNPVSFWQVTGMFVLVYAPAYWWAGRHPEKHYHFICIGFLGKLFGPLGFIWATNSGQLPLAFGWIILFNDVIWWPVFAAYLTKIYQLHGMKAILKGE